MILIGSRAAATRHIRNRPITKDTDWDVIGTVGELNKLADQSVEFVPSSKWDGIYRLTLQNGRRVEFDATDNPSNRKILEAVDTQGDNLLVPLTHRMNVRIPQVDILYTIKRSHAYFPIHFEKTLKDLAVFQKMGAKITHKTEDIFFERKKEVENRINLRKKINLNKPNDAFFAPAEHLRRYEHDSLHEVMAYYDRPLYERCKKDLAVAKISRELFQQLSKGDQLKMAREEIQVIAIERYYIPLFEDENYKPLTDQQRQSLYVKGLLKVSRDLCTGWFQDFILDNLSELIYSDRNLDLIFINGAKEGRLKIK